MKMTSVFKHVSVDDEQKCIDENPLKKMYQVVMALSIPILSSPDFRREDKVKFKFKNK